MKPRLPLALALAGFMGAGLFFTAEIATAQQSQPNAQTADASEDAPPSQADRAAFLDARIAALHAGLTLTPDQEKLWPPVEAALRDLSKTMHMQFKQMREARHEHKFMGDPVGRLKQMAENQLARGEAMKKLADAAEPLYAKLTDEQKHRLHPLLHAIHPHFKHHERADEDEGGRGNGHWWHHHDHEQQSGDHDEDDSGPEHE